MHGKVAKTHCRLRKALGTRSAQRSHCDGKMAAHLKASALAVRHHVASKLALLCRRDTKFSTDAASKHLHPDQLFLWRKDPRYPKAPRTGHTCSAIVPWTSMLSTPPSFCRITITLSFSSRETGSPEIAGCMAADGAALLAAVAPLSTCARRSRN